MFGLEFSDLLLVNGNCVSRDDLSRASATPAMTINVAATAMEEDNILLVPSTSCFSDETKESILM